MKTPNTHRNFSKDLVIFRTNSKIACSFEKVNCFGKRGLFSTKQLKTRLYIIFSNIFENTDWTEIGL